MFSLLPLLCRRFVHGNAVSMRHAFFEQLEQRRMLAGCGCGGHEAGDGMAGLAPSGCPSCGGSGSCPACRTAALMAAPGAGGDGSPAPLLTAEGDDFAATINFQPDGVGPVEFTRADFGRPFGLRGNGLRYGWSRDLEEAGDMIDRDSTRDLPGLTVGGRTGNGPASESQDVDERYDNFASVEVGDTWSIEVPNGTYAVAIVSGDPEFQGSLSDANHIWNLNGNRILRAQPLPTYPWGDAAVFIEVTDNRITLEAAEGSLNNSLSWLRVAEIPARPDYEQGREIFWNFAGEEIVSPVRRVEGGSVVVGNRMYVIGGFGAAYTSVYNRVDILNIDTFEWTRGADLPAGVAETHAAFAADEARGHIYWISGQTGTGENGATFNVSPDVWRYIIADDRWERFVDLPASRYGGGAAVIGDVLYTFGGDDESRVIARGDGWKIDLSLPTTDADEDGVPAGPEWLDIALMPAPADHLNAEVLDGLIYVTGGEYAHGVGYVQRAELQIYDPAADTWRLGAPLPTPTSHNRAIVHDDRIWVFGGQKEAQRVVTEVRSYDPSRDVWELHDPFPETRKSGFPFVKDDRFYYVAGDAFLEGFPLTTLVGELR